MKRKESKSYLFRLLAWGTGLLGLMSVPARVEAIPAFARQMHMQCTACHYQNFPELNAFGRAFKDSGYTLMGGPETESEIKGDKDNLTLPFVLNASVFFDGAYTKTNGRSPSVAPYADARNAMINQQFGTNLPNAYQVGAWGGTPSGPYANNGAFNAVNPALNAVASATAFNNANAAGIAAGTTTAQTASDYPGTSSTTYYSQNRIRQYDTNKGQYQFPYGDASLFIGGHAGDHVGFFFQMNSTGAPSFDGFKMPMNWDVAGQRVLIVPFATGADSVEYGYDPMNTGFFGAMAFNGAGNTAGEFLNYNSYNYDGAATGTAFVVKNDFYWVNASAWSPTFNTFASGGPTDKPTAGYGQVGISPHVGDFDILVSARAWGGHARVNDPAQSMFNGAYPNEMQNVETNALGGDVQVQGPVAGIPIGLYFSAFEAPPSQKQTVVEPTSVAGVASTYQGPSNALTTGIDFNQQPPVLTTNGVPIGANAIAYRVPGTPNLFNAGYSTKHAASIGFKAGVIPDTLVLFVNYLVATNGNFSHGEQSNMDYGQVVNPWDGSTAGYTKYKAANVHDVATVGASYALAENVRFELNYSHSMGSEFDKGNVLNRRQVIDPGNLQQLPVSGLQRGPTPQGRDNIFFRMIAGL